MGGRGRSSGISVRQYTIEDARLQKRILDITRESSKSRAVLVVNGNGSSGANPQTLFKKCACCGEYSIPVGTEYQNCPVCGWVDDPYQNKHPLEVKGRNAQSLMQAREEYAKKIKRV